MRGGQRKGAGRKPGSKKESRLIQKFCRFNKEEIDIIEKAANIEKKAVARFISDAAVEIALMRLAHS